MAGILAIALARLSRRVASGLGGTPAASARIVSIAGVLGPALAFLGPSLLLNGASRFSHTMVLACFAWSIESLCMMCDRGVAHRPARGYGFLLGSALALGLATRPADGGLLAVGVFLYFVWALYRRRLRWNALLAAAIGFACFGGLDADHPAAATRGLVQDRLRAVAFHSRRSGAASQLAEPR